MKLFFPISLVLIGIAGFFIGYFLNSIINHLAQKILPPPEIILLPYRPLLVNLSSAFITLVIYFFFYQSFLVLIFLLLSWSLLILFFIDLENQILPNEITLLLLGFGLLSTTFELLIDLKSAALGAILGYGFFALVAHLSYLIRKEECLGQGDIKLLTALGSWFGWQFLPAIIFIASFLGTMSGYLYLILKKQKTMRIPFGPFLVTAAFIMLLSQPFFKKFLTGSI